MIYDILAIFSDSELVEVEFTLNQCTLMGQGMKNQLIKAVEDYKFLVSNLCFAKGLSEQVILFLLDPDSCTIEGVNEFLQKLELWVVILENEAEQRIYAEIIRHWGSLYYLENQELLAFRSELISALEEVAETKRSLKKTKNSQDSLVKNKIPMQLSENFPDYSTWMMNYGEEFEVESSSFNIVPNLKGKLTDAGHPYYNSFEVYTQNYEVPTLQD